MIFFMLIIELSDLQKYLFLVEIFLIAFDPFSIKSIEIFSIYTQFFLRTTNRNQTLSANQ